MRIPCSDLDCPNWILPEISTLAKIYEKILKLTFDAKFLLSPKSGDVKATIAVLSFILSSAAKHRVDSDSLSNELQQLGLPKEHAAGLCWSYEEKQSPLQDSWRTRSLRLNHLDAVSWRVDQTLSSSELQQVSEPLPFAIIVSAEKFPILLAELRQAHAMMKTLS
uniref:COMM domain-containing protein n=1 Tax=Gopherus evgoodei TaxID=1825980 RepID=A0A8C4VRH2_9SAUR